MSAFLMSAFLKPRGRQLSAPAREDLPDICQLSGLRSRDPGSHRDCQLYDRTHDGKRDKDAELDTILGQAAYCLVRWDSPRKPAETAIAAEMQALRGRVGTVLGATR
jgi:hypothetical protein